MANYTTIVNNYATMALEDSPEVLKDTTTTTPTTTPKGEHEPTLYQTFSSSSLYSSASSLYSTALEQENLYLLHDSHDSHPHHTSTPSQPTTRESQRPSLRTTLVTPPAPVSSVMTSVSAAPVTTPINRYMDSATAFGDDPHPDHTHHPFITPSSLYSTPSAYLSAGEEQELRRSTEHMEVSADGYLSGGYNETSAITSTPYGDGLIDGGYSDSNVSSSYTSTITLPPSSFPIPTSASNTTKHGQTPKFVDVVASQSPKKLKTEGKGTREQGIFETMISQLDPRKLKEAVLRLASKLPQDQLASSSIGLNELLSEYHAVAYLPPSSIPDTEDETNMLKKGGDEKDFRAVGNRDWNAEFQPLRDVLLELSHAGSKTVRSPCVPDPEHRKLLDRLSQLQGDFYYAAKTYARIIVSELSLPDCQKTIPPVQIGGIAGGAKYIMKGIMFKVLTLLFYPLPSILFFLLLFFLFFYSSLFLFPHFLLVCFGSNDYGQTSPSLDVRWKSKRRSISDQGSGKGIRCSSNLHCDGEDETSFSSSGLDRLQRF
jgi:hypothetical protein